MISSPPSMLLLGTRPRDASGDEPFHNLGHDRVEHRGADDGRRRTDPALETVFISPRPRPRLRCRSRRRPVHAAWAGIGAPPGRWRAQGWSRRSPGHQHLARCASRDATALLPEFEATTRTSPSTIPWSSKRVRELRQTLHGRAQAHAAVQRQPFEEDGAHALETALPGSTVREHVGVARAECVQGSSVRSASAITRAASSKASHPSRDDRSMSSRTTWRCRPAEGSRRLTSPTRARRGSASAWTGLTRRGQPDGTVQRVTRRHRAAGGRSRSRCSIVPDEP